MRGLNLSKGNQILAGLLALQIVVAVVIFWPRPLGAEGRETQPLLPGLEADQVMRVTIRDDKDTQIVLARKEGKWVLADAGDYPCRDDVVQKFLEKLVGLKTGRLVTETAASHKRLRVAEDDYLRLVELELADGAVHRLYVGTSPSYSVSHVRAEGQNPVYLVSDLSSTDASTMAGTWIDTAYVTIPADQIAALTLENANGTIEFVRQDDEWTLADLGPDETANKTAISTLINRITSLRMVRPLGTEPRPEYGMQDPSAVVIAQVRDESGAMVPRAVHVGALDAGGEGYVVKYSESPYFVRVAEFTVKDWVEKTRNDLLEAEATPTLSN